MHELELKILKEFNDIKDHLIAWGSFVDSKIMEIFNESSLSHEVKIIPKSRLKDDRSFLSKALWRKKGYENPLLAIEDKIGTRVVLLKTDDIKPASEYLSTSSFWQAKTTKDLKDIIDGKPKEFDYQSMHIVVWPNDNDKMFPPEIIPFLTCEIQIRTLLQHAFAEVSHDSTYKGPYLNDAEIIRSLSKSMALMEATDDYFCRVFEMMGDEKRKYRNYIKELMSLYKKYNKDFARENLDIDLTDIIFELLSIKDVPIASVSEFLEKNDKDISAAITGNKTHLFNQPVILLIGYYIYNHRHFLKENWPLSFESLNEVFTGFGISLD